LIVICFLNQGFLSQVSGASPAGAMVVRERAAKAVYKALKEPSGNQAG